LDRKALDNIIRRIQDDANRKIEEYRKIADMKRKEILDRAEVEMRKELDSFAAGKEREIENMVKYIVSQAKISGKRMVLEEREKGIETVFHEAERKAAQSEGYQGYLKRALGKAKDSLGSGTVECRKSDESVISSMLPPDFELKGYLDEEEPGIIAYTADGKRALDMRISRKIEDMRDELRKEVSMLLYGGEGQ